MTNVPNGAEALVRMLAAHGVRHIFGLCGDTSLPFYDALRNMDHGITHVLTRDERSATYMADAYARVTGQPGVAEGPSGGGATYILPGLIEASESSYPVLGITTDISVASYGKYPLTEVDQEAMMRPLTKWNTVIKRADHIPRMVRAAFRAMTTGRPGAAHLGLPYDIQYDPVDAADLWADPALARYPSYPAAPQPGAAEAAVEAILSAKSPLIVCGGGVVLAGACEALAEFVEALGVPVCTTVSGQGALAESHPLCVGVVGSNGGQPATRRLVDEADCVFFIGCRAGSVTTERWSSPAAGAVILHLDNDPAVIGACYPTRAAIVADAGMALVDLTLALEDRTFAKLDGAARVAEAKAEKWAAFTALASSDAAPILPERVIADLRAALPDDAIICADPGTPCPYFSAWYDWPQSGRRFLTNRAHGALGWALGASIGAQIGQPNAKVVCAMGDGSFGMSVGELETVKRLGLPITYIVFSNAVFGWIKAGQKSGFDERYFSVDFTRTDHRAVAEAYGLKAWTVEAAADLRPTLAKAISHDGPTLIDVIAQPLQDAAAPVSEWVA